MNDVLGLGVGAFGLLVGVDGGRVVFGQAGGGFFAGGFGVEDGGEFLRQRRVVP
jgi:hypothetical protein